MYLHRTKIDSYVMSRSIMLLTLRINLKVLRVVLTTQKKSHGILDLILIPRLTITFLAIYLMMFIILMLLRRDLSLKLKMLATKIIKRRNVVRIEIMI